jgi:hypothetical protein
MGRDPSPVYRSMAASDRRAIFQILLDTKPEFATAANTFFSER